MGGEFCVPPNSSWHIKPFHADSINALRSCTVLLAAVSVTYLVDSVISLSALAAAAAAMASLNWRTSSRSDAGTGMSWMAFFMDKVVVAAMVA